MFLSDTDILKAVKSEDITLSDFEESRLQPASYDILLGNKFLTLKQHSTTIIDPTKKILPEYDEIVIEDGWEFVLHPGVSLLWISKDYFGSSKYLIQLSGKSSLARIGLIVHNTAGLINPGHYLNIAFELCNLNSVPIILRPGMEIAQLIFAEISSPPEHTYEKKGRYANENWWSYKEKN